MGMRAILLWLGILWGALSPGGAAWATAQAPDLIRYEGEECLLFSEPLNAFWKPGNPRPTFVPTNTANWRGYTASWEIAEGVLYLIEIRGQIGKPDGTLSQATLAELFPGHTGKVEAVWFTGTLRVPWGKRLHFTRAGYGAIYEKELVIRVERGRVVGSPVVGTSTQGGGLPPAHERP
jgi:hypothetical protein